MERKNILLKSEPCEEYSESILYENIRKTEEFITNFFGALTCESSNYNANKTIELISNFVSTNGKTTRILYSQIYQKMCAVSEEERATILANLEILVSKFSQENGDDHDCQRMLLKIKDHIDLINYQFGDRNDIIAQLTKKVNDDIKSEIRKTEKDYVSILGIFASIILTFVASITFSTSIIENASKLDTFKLIYTICLLGFILINTIFILLKFVLKITGNEEKMEYVCILNKVIITIFALTLIANIFTML